jgi:hypothetical protein
MTHIRQLQSCPLARAALAVLPHKVIKCLADFDTSLGKDLQFHLVKGRFSDIPEVRSNGMMPSNPIDLMVEEAETEAMYLPFPHAVYYKEDGGIYPLVHELGHVVDNALGYRERGVIKAMMSDYDPAVVAEWRANSMAHTAVDDEDYENVNDYFADVFAMWTGVKVQPEIAAEGHFTKEWVRVHSPYTFNLLESEFKTKHERTP